MDGAVTADGCPVEVYAQLPTFGEPEWIHSVVPAGASILDLGSGVGRLADPLVELGHRVVAVDDSTEMLAHVTRAATVHSRIEELDLDERFDVVILASHLVNTADGGLRAALLGTARHHLAAGGLVLAEWHPPEWFDGLGTGAHAPGSLGEVTSTLRVSALHDGLLTAAVDYELGGQRWTQHFTARRLSRAALDVELAAAGLERLPSGPAWRDWWAAATAQPPSTRTLER